MNGTEIVNRLKVGSKSSVKDVAANSVEFNLHKETALIFGGRKILHRVSLKNSIYEVGWVLNDQTASCLRCNVGFGIFSWRHHCRECGYLVCSPCSSNVSVILALNSDNSRTCNMCFQKLLRRDSMQQLPNVQCELSDNHSQSNVIGEILNESKQSDLVVTTEKTDTTNTDTSNTINRIIISTTPPTKPDPQSTTDSDEVSSKSILGLYLDTTTHSGKTTNSFKGQGSMDVSSSDGDDSGEDERREGARSTTPTQQQEQHSEEEGGHNPRIVSYRGEGANWQTVYQQQLKEEEEQEEESQLTPVSSSDGRGAGSPRQMSPLSAVDSALPSTPSHRTDSPGQQNQPDVTADVTSRPEQLQREEQVTTLANLTPLTSRRILETALHNGGIWEDSDSDTSSQATSSANNTPQSVSVVSGHLQSSVTPVTVSKPINRGVAGEVEAIDEGGLSRSSVFADIIEEDLLNDCCEQEIVVE